MAANVSEVVDAVNNDTHGRLTIQGVLGQKTGYVYIHSTDSDDKGH